MLRPESNRIPEGGLSGVDVFLDHRSLQEHGYPSFDFDLVAA